MKYYVQILFAIFYLVGPSSSDAHTSIAMVHEHAPETYSVSSNYGSQREADQAALKGCSEAAVRNGIPKQAGKCKVMDRQKGPGFGAIVCGESTCSWVSGYDQKQEAVDSAHQTCTKSDNCPDTDILAWEDFAGYPKPRQEIHQRTKACSPPAGQVVRSRTECTNGACLRTFENGCQVQFNAPYCFDPLQQRWDWKPDGC